jgi:hypothetical protein
VEWRNRGQSELEQDAGHPAGATEHPQVNTRQTS